MFAYQPSVKIDKGIEYVIGWKSKGLYNSKLIALHSAFLPDVKHFGNKIEMQFNNTPLVTEQISYTKNL